MLAYAALLLAAPLVAFVALPSLLLSAPVFIPAAAALLAFYFWALAPVTRLAAPKRANQVGAAYPKTSRSFQNARYDSLLTTPADDVSTVPGLLRRAVESFGSQPALGWRTVERVEPRTVEIERDGQMVKKVVQHPYLSEYKWMTYAQLGRKVARAGAGLERLGLRKGQHVAFFAATRPEWQVCAQGCFARGLPVVTVYASLGPDALAHCLGEAGVTHVVTEVTLVDKVFDTVADPNGPDGITHVIVIENRGPCGQKLTAEKRDELEERNPHIKVTTYAELLELGEDCRAPRNQPTPDDLAVIMYTSGSTGNPKGVMMSHANIVAAVAGISNSIPPAQGITPADAYLAFLPLAHVLELVAEHILMVNGGRLGYGSPHTLKSDSASDATTGEPCGDILALRPTLFAAVPLVIDRLRAAVEKKVAGAPLPRRLLFKVAYHFKQRAYQQGRSSPLLDRLVFSKVAATFGGRLRLVLSGGAPLSAESQDFMNVCFCCPVLQGYGLTETCGAATVCDPRDKTVGGVGPPVPSVRIRLADVPEMSYLSTDQPHPRGEVLIHGANVTLGYYKLPDKTDEAFFVEPTDGSRWFRTGDVGKMTDAGLVIIDRVKDLVKLSHGEYIALGNLEASCRQAPVVENVMIWANSNKQHPVAVVQPNQSELMDIAKEVMDGGDANDWDKVCSDARVNERVLAQLQEQLKARKCKRWEIVQAVHLTTEEWTPESGLLTEAMKLKRAAVTAKYIDDLQALY